MDFSGVTEVKIPQGNVTRITETSSGRVLWEGFPIDVKAHWELLEFENDEANRNYYERIRDVVDTGDGLEFFCDGLISSSNDKARPSRRFHYKADGTYGDVYTLWRGTKLQEDDIAQINYYKLSLDEQDATTPPITDSTWSRGVHCADIDPVSKVWCLAVGGKYYVSNALSPIKIKAGLSINIAPHLVCWSSKLKRFCLVGDAGSALVDINGNVTGIKKSLSASEGATNGNISTLNGNMIWSDTLDKFVICRASGTTGYTQLIMSEDGLNWSNVSAVFTGGKPDKLNTGSGEGTKILTGLCFIDRLGKFLVSNTYDKHYIYESTDCKNWNCIAEKPNTLGSTNATSNPSSLVYSPKKRVLLLSDRKTSYVTRDLETWIEVPYASGTNTTMITRRWVRWSDSLKAFIRTYAPGGLTGNSKLVIEN